MSNSRRGSTRWCLLAITLAWAVISTPAADWQELAKLTASDGATDDTFGHHVAIWGDTAVIGACEDNDNGSDPGSAYVFKDVAGAWTEMAKLTASDGASGDLFGWSVGVSDDAVIVAARDDDDCGGGSGSAYVFEIVGGVWTEVAKLTASDGSANDHFAWSVAISGDGAVVGANQDDNANGTDAGAAYIFEKIGGVWCEVAKLTASDGEPYARLGGWVAISGDTALVGSPRHDGPAGENYGSAYIFEKVGRVWTQVAKLTASDGADDDWFGTSVAICDDIAAIGAYHDDDDGYHSGSAYVFEKVGSVWTEVAKLTASDGGAYDLFGFCVSVSGDTAVIGSMWDDDNGSNSGSAYVFQRVGGIWTEVAKLTASDGAAGDWFGSGVAVWADTALIGVRYDDDNGSDSGSAYVFEPVGPECPGDVSGDGDTDEVDLGILLAVWGMCVGDPDYMPEADLNSDGCIDQADLGILLADWGCNVRP